jgi:hypothetical protein
MASQQSEWLCWSATIRTISELVHVLHFRTSALTDSPVGHRRGIFSGTSGDRWANLRCGQKL